MARWFVNQKGAASVRYDNKQSAKRAAKSLKGSVVTAKRPRYYPKHEKKSFITRLIGL